MALYSCTAVDIARAMEVFSTDLSKKRTDALAQIRARAREHLGSWLDDHDAVSIAIGAATRVSHELLEYLCARTIAKKAIQNAKSIAITSDEWNNLFGHEAKPMRVSALDPLSREAAYGQATRDLCDALKTTIEETEQRDIWNRPMTQAACTIAMHMESHETHMSSCLGNIVRSDLRRLEDLHYRLEDESTDCMLIGVTLNALSMAVV